ncbi:MAG TPA: type II toxin-antitoxin system HicB family antitoxin [Dyella sp.]|uniref:type II toxin-antitoxin system HicB family antitoxin n=1 Tax=Dyella sp. TaxID=1869338 RepID=UPI002D03AC46|nr:type II toxin-antitoxin system HicB family antitoxin [Dyella sp.]HUB92001.1 type II toxin-antitoxin system HicB family antitoxin [Dyella sp.]
MNYDTQTMIPYSINIIWSEEDAGYIANVAELPGCSAWGSTEAEALSNVKSAINAWIEAAKAAGNAIPF